jgi:hypothetical protein
MAIIDFTDEQKAIGTKMWAHEPERLDPSPDRNIIFVGEGEPTLEFHGAFKVKLPDAETQRKGFYHEKAAAIIQHHSKLYKKFVRKGDK